MPAALSVDRKNSLTDLAADYRYEADASARRSAKVVRQSDLRFLDLPRARFAAHLQPHFVHHPQPRCADRLPERLEAAVGIDRQLTFEVEEPVHHVLPCGPARTEAEILVEHELGRREAIVNFGHADLLARIRNARLRVSVFGCGDDFAEAREIVILRQRPFGRTRDERERLDVDGTLAVLV